MLKFSQARRIAEVWVANTTDIEVELVREAVQAKPYGWVFFYQSSAFLQDPNDFGSQLAGNGPFLIDRFNGELRVFGTAFPVETYLEQFERELPSSWLYATPEQPCW